MKTNPTQAIGILFFLAGLNLMIVSYNPVFSLEWFMVLCLIGSMLVITGLAIFTDASK